MMKKYVIGMSILIAILCLTSCVGIGDGAMFDNITTGEPNEITLEPEGVAVAKLVAYKSDRTVMGELEVTGSDAMELYEYLTDSSNYTNDTETNMMEKASVHITFEGINSQIDLDSNNAEDVFDTFYIDSDDIVSMNVSETEWGRTGRFDGVYETLLSKILNNVTDEEIAAGFKLNCLQVEMKPEISRRFILSDFEDIGGFYLYDFEDQPMFSSFYFPRESVIVYFKSCTPAELEEKIAMIKENSVVKSASKIIVKYPDSK
jgi:hypothetical protein